jgi:hypothetical protein
MADRWEQTTSGYSFRFFSPEQVDEILRDGTRRGHEGSHAAIERILKHEPGLQRYELWQRMRRLNKPEGQQHHSRSVWSLEDERILREGYQAGWQGKQEAVRQLLRHHPDWRPHAIWQHARKNGFVQRTSKRGQERSRDCQGQRNLSRLTLPLSSMLEPVQANLPGGLFSTALKNNGMANEQKLLYAPPCFRHENRERCCHPLALS